MCELTKTWLNKYIKEMINSDTYTAEMTEAINLFILRTLYSSVSDIRAVENHGIQKNDIGISVPENQYGWLEFKYQISKIQNPAEIILNGNFGSKDRSICANFRRI